MERERPIGYWLKELDARIEAAFDQAFAAEGLTRRHWQVMNVLAGAPRDEPDLVEALRPFWGEGAINLSEVTKGLRDRGWVAEEGGRYALTPDGERAREAVATRVQGIRGSMAAGITEDDYRTTLRVLQRMASNLEPPG